MRCSVELHNIERAAFGDLDAVLAFTARLCAIGIETIQRLCEDSAGGSLAYTARTDKKICVRDATRFYGMLQRTHNMLLSDDIAECHRAVLERQGYMLPAAGGFFFIVHYGGLYHRKPYAIKLVSDVRDV